jgi:hypothetical protein
VVDRCLGLRVESRRGQGCLCCVFYVKEEDKMQNNQEKGTSTDEVQNTREYKKKNAARAWMFIFCAVNSSKQFS